MILRVRFPLVAAFVSLVGCSHNEGMPDRQMAEMNETVGKVQRDQDKEATAFMDEPSLAAKPASKNNAAGSPTPRGTVQLNDDGSDGENDDPDAPAARPEIRVQGGGGSYARPSRSTSSSSTKSARMPADEGAFRTDGPHSAPLDPEAKKAYDAAIALVQSKQYDRGLEELTAFLAKWPDHPYVENALYWKGECLYATGQYLRAAEQFEAVVNRYGAGKKGADALLKLGMCHDRLGASDRANQYWDRLRRDFPRSEAAKKIPVSTSSDSTRRTAGPKESR